LIRLPLSDHSCPRPAESGQNEPKSDCFRCIFASVRKSEMSRATLLISHGSSTPFKLVGVRFDPHCRVPFVSDRVDAALSLLEVRRYPEANSHRNKSEIMLQTVGQSWSALRYPLCALPGAHRSERGLLFLRCLLEQRLLERRGISDRVVVPEQRDQ